MKQILLLGIVALLALLALGVVVALYQHKKYASGNVRLLGEVGRVETPLAPEGSIIIGGELWPAKSKDGSDFAVGTRVRVVGFEGHLALVESYK